jgi:hypothetical protein
MSVPNPTQSNFANHLIGISPSVAAPPALPTSTMPLPCSAEEYAKLPDSSKSLYLDYMLCNQIPLGPFDESAEGTKRQSLIERLIIDLQRNQQFTALAQLMERCGAISRLPVLINEFTPAAIDQFLRAVQIHQPGLNRIYVFNNHRFKTESDENTKILAHFISQNPHITSFKLFYLLDSTISLLVNAIGTHHNLTEIDISPRRAMSDETCEKLCNVIQSSKQLRVFNLFRPSISEQSKLGIVLALSGSQQLEKIGICYWVMDEPETLTCLTQLLKSLPVLKDLTFATDLNRLPLTDHDPMPPQDYEASKREISALADGIEKHPSLTSLRLETLGHQYEVRHKLIETLHHMPSISALEIGSLSRYVIPTMEDIATLLEKNPNITRLTSDGKDTLAYPYALQQHTPELAKKVKEEYPQFQAIVQRINDSLAKNRAIASSIWARVFSNALPIDQTSSTRPNSIADANQLLASHILNNSSNLDEFQRTMIEIALSTEELADKAMPPPVTQQTNDEGIVLQNTHQHNGEPDATG